MDQVIGDRRRPVRHLQALYTVVGGDRPRKYWSDLKKKLAAEGYSEVSEKIGQLKMTAPDGKQRFTDCANTETLLRIIQSIPSPKVEPLKRWLARVGIGDIAKNDKLQGRCEAGRLTSCPDAWSA
jgi:hypothetical protein